MIKTVEKEVFNLKSEILSLKTFNLELQSSLNAIKDILKSTKIVNNNETEQNIVPLFSCEFCDLEFINEEILKKHLSSVHVTNIEVEQENFKCDYKSKSKKGVNIHRGSKHKSAPKIASPPSPSLQTPINCILKDDGCPNILNTYFNKYTAICSSCQDFLEKKLKSSPFSPDLCPCCHQNSNGAQYSLCSECLESIQDDGYAELGIVASG